MFWEGGRESGEDDVVPSGTLCREVFHSIRLSSVKTLWAIYMMVLARGPQWVCGAKVCVVMEEHTALGCYRSPVPYSRAGAKGLQSSHICSSPVPFWTYAINIAPVHYWSGHLTLHWWLCFTCWVRELANSCYSFVFKLFWKDSLEDLHNF